MLLIFRRFKRSVNNVDFFSICCAFSQVFYLCATVFVLLLYFGQLLVLLALFCSRCQFTVCVIVSWSDDDDTDVIGYKATIKSHQRR